MKKLIFKQLILTLLMSLLFLTAITISKSKDNSKLFKQENFSIRVCMSEAKNFYPNKSKLELNQLCCKSYSDYLKELSKESNSIVTGIYTDGYCKDEWFN